MDNRIIQYGVGERLYWFEWLLCIIWFLAFAPIGYLAIWFERVTFGLPIGFDEPATGAAAVVLGYISLCGSYGGIHWLFRNTQFRTRLLMEPVVFALLVASGGLVHYVRVAS